MEIKVITRPSVYLVSRPTSHVDLLAFLKDHTANKWEMDFRTGDGLPELGGRLCYMSFDAPRPGGNAAYLGHIKNSGHGSVLEHSTYGFIFTGISRTCTHELVRHRSGFAYSQLSQRYVDETANPEYVLPWEYRDDDERKTQWVASMKSATLAYAAAVKGKVEKLKIKEYDRYVATREGPDFLPIDTWWAGLDTQVKTHIRKAARGAARSELPNATETKIMVTANCRAWRHFLEMRCSPHADAEIRMLAYEVYKILKCEAPNLFSDYTEVPQDDGTVALDTKFKKV